MKEPIEPISTVRDALLQSLDTAFDKRSWHGASLLGAIRGVSASTAARHPHGRKSVWQQVLHAAYWKQRILNKLAAERTPFPRKGTNWPKLPDPIDETGWAEDVELLRDIHQRLRTRVAAMPAKKLDGKTVWLIHGAAAHDLYHAGQIKLLLRLLGKP